MCPCGRRSVCAPSRKPASVIPRGPACHRETPAFCGACPLNRAERLRDVLRVQLLQTLMAKGPYLHLTHCSLSLNTCQSKNVRSLKQALARGGPTADDISGERLPNYVRGFSTPHSCRQMRSFIAESLSQAAKTGPSSSLNTPKHLQPPEQVSVPAVPRTTECGCFATCRSLPNTVS